MSEMVGPQRPRIAVNVCKTNCNKVVNNESLNGKQDINEDNTLETGYYLHRNKLGEGGFGTVRLGTHLKTGMKVAVKMMNKKKLAHDLFRVRIEISSLKVLQHENIAKLLQVIETDEDIYLILEYCSGGELFDYLVSKTRLSETESMSIMKDLMSALAFIHQNGFAHRDLKPENLLFDSNHKIKLIDFGLAAMCQDNNSSLAHLKTCCGSPAYAAPELLQGNHYSGPSVDVWSAGVLLYALLVGKLPFDDENIGALYKKIQSGVYRIPDWLSKDAKDLIQSMLTLNPNTRITVNDILKHQWMCSKGQQLSQQSALQVIKCNIDDEVLFNCHLMFREIPIRQLRKNILHGFGYQTATYWLLKDKFSRQSVGIQPSLLPMTLHQFSVNPNKHIPVQRRRSKSLDVKVDQQKDNEIPVSSGNKPKLIGAKRKANDNIKGSPIKVGVKAIKQTAVGSPSKIPIRLSDNKSTPKSDENKVLINNNASPVNSPVVPNKRPRLFRPFIDMKAAEFKSPAKNQVKSPLRIKSPNVKSFSPKTPTNAKIENTPKKSLFKRILETATPAKSQTPRIITTSSGSKNITLTNFTEPQDCIAKLVETLTMKGIQCKQKEFCLRCVLSTKNTIILSFNLEILKFENRCVIQRKRLKGDSWNYKRVCEDILRISNE